jgi:3-hydroxyacyl-CoA dehydrogenase/enoyl-CoA hydratase/3-hydroxybutyryl-CoA epimerase
MDDSKQGSLVTFDVRDDGIALIEIDVPGRAVNTLSTRMTERFESFLDRIEDDDGIRGVVIRSAKPDTFVAGFDIEELKGHRQRPGALRDLVDKGHRLTARLEDVSVPIVAAIDGDCLGGGLELAMACTARVAADTPETEFGLPEIKLGVIPGMGGTQRLPRLVDPQLALEMILTGRTIDADRAAEEGLVDDVAHPGILVDVAVEWIDRIESRGTPDRQPEEPLEALRNFWRDPSGEAMKWAARSPARRLVFDQARQRARKTAGSHYPAPPRAIDVIETGFRDGFEAGLEAEADAFVELIQTDVAGHLMEVFFAQRQAGSDAVADDVSSYPVDKIGVLGAGLMGAGIAQSAAYNGYAVRLKDKDLEGLGWGLDYSARLFDKLVDRGKLTEPMADVAFGRIGGTTDWSGFNNCDLVIEAVYEDLELKRQMLGEVESRSDDTTIFASNTSTIPIEEIAAQSERPEQVLGMHFFSPVHKMPLLEIIRTEATDERALATALEVGNRLGKTCIVVKDGPGFFTSRVIGAYINEAGWLLQEGGRVEAIDQAMRDFGFSVGPLKLIDEVGFDVATKAGRTIKEAFPERWNAPEVLEELADEGRLGKKNDWGFYDYEHGAPDEVDESVYDVLSGGLDRRSIDPELIQDRCWMAMLNECVRCLEEGIVEEPRDIDVGVIFGLGFPPFRGGILRYADARGLQGIVETMDRLADEFGDRLRPAELLREKASEGGSFHP